MSEEQAQALLDFVKKLAECAQDKPFTKQEGFNPYDWSGGNIDDAYQLGIGSMEESIGNDAKKLLEKLGLNG